MKFRQGNPVEILLSISLKGCGVGAVVCLAVELTCHFQSLDRLENRIPLLVLLTAEHGTHVEFAVLLRLHQLAFESVLQRKSLESVHVSFKDEAIFDELEVLIA